MSTDNSAKGIVLGSRIPKDGDLLKWNDTAGGWIPTTLDSELASATKLGIYTLPTVDGNSGDVLSTDGSGVLSWITP